MKKEDSPQDDFDCEYGDEDNLFSDPGEEPVDFGSFAISLGHSAYISMGKVDHPDGKTRSVDLESAKEMISILEMLRKKTKGNLNKEEKRMLCSLLYELRMAYVELQT